MTTGEHAALGAVVATLPDVVLWTFGWRRVWLPVGHPLVRAHYWLHSRRALPWLCLAAWCSHLIADRYSPHRRRA